MIWVAGEASLGGTALGGQVFLAWYKLTFIIVRLGNIVGFTDVKSLKQYWGLTVCLMFAPVIS